LLGDLAARLAAVKPLLGFAHDFGGEHGRSPATAWLIERFGALLAELLHTAFDAIGGNAEGANDLGLSAGALTDQLGGKHTKRQLILFVMAKDGAYAQEVRPLPLLADDAERIIDRGSTMGDQWQ
jgi:hypothetical protein